MYAINMGDGTYTVHNRNLQIDTKLPPAVYRVQCAEKSGFYLEMMPDIRVYEKIYGKVNDRIDMIIDSFEKSPRSIGAIFSGVKGLGKSLAAMRICERMLDKGLPIIIVDTAIRGTAQFIQSIEQEVVVFFDEYDKTFKDSMGLGNASEFNLRQCSIEMLGLFDGIDRTKRLYLITCNEVINISRFLLNRPGRFHYHIKFTYPTKEDVREYLKDNLRNSDPKYVDKIVKFTLSNVVNFDALRAICFELNNGHKFDDIIETLNIYSGVDGVTSTATAITEDGTMYTGTHIRIFPNTTGSTNAILYTSNAPNLAVRMNTKDLEFDEEHMGYVPKDLSNVVANLCIKKGNKEVKLRSLVFVIDTSAGRY